MAKRDYYEVLGVDRGASADEIKKADFYKEGDQIWVKCLGTDNRGKIRLSAKRVNQETGEDA